MAPVWHAPASWLPGAVCVHEHEGAWTSAGAYGGGMQFMVSTWNSVAGGDVPYARTTADIGRQPPRVQLHAAYLRWLRDGRVWAIRDGGSWGTSADLCGLR